MVLTSLVFLSAGILWPQGAGALLRIMLVVIAVGFIAARAHDALQLVRTGRQVRSPFDAGSTERTAPATPQVLRDLTDQLVAADDPRTRDRAAVPWPVRRTLVGEATHRLAEHHGLDPADPGHHARIRALVSAATWRLIAAAELTRADGHAARAPHAHGAPHARGSLRADAALRPDHTPPRAVRQSDVPLRELTLILDDLERL